MLDQALNVCKVKFLNSLLEGLEFLSLSVEQNDFVTTAVNDFAESLLRILCLENLRLLKERLREMKWKRLIHPCDPQPAKKASNTEEPTLEFYSNRYYKGFFRILRPSTSLNE